MKKILILFVILLIPVSSFNISSGLDLFNKAIEKQLIISSESFDGIININANEAWLMLNNQSNGIQIPIDVRSDSEWWNERIDSPYPEDPKHYPLTDLQNQNGLLNFLLIYNNTEIILYCKSGGRSSSAAAIIDNSDFNGTIYNMQGGISSWKEAGYPIKIKNERPNQPDKPSGPETGYNGVSYKFSTSTIDPDEDSIRYGWDWDADETIDYWTSYYPSSEIVSIEHIWESTGIYNIKVLAEDNVGDISNFSEVLTIVLTKKPPSTLYVGGNGPGNYSSIQGAIDDARDNDKIFVYSHLSPYYENIIIDKSISLIGEDKNNTVINGENKKDAIKIQADFVNITGFTIRNGGGSLNNEGGIKLNSSKNCKIDNNNIIDNYLYGIYIFNNKSTNNVISNNKISNNGNEQRGGLNIWLLQSPNNSILNNVIEKGKGSGIAICSFSINTTIIGNIIKDNNLEGIKSRYSYNNKIYKNTIEDNNYFGIRLLNASADNLFEKNNFVNNKPINVFFTLNDNSQSNYWNGNYWNRARMLPKPILGCLRLDSISKDMIGIPWLNFDMSPAKKSIDINQ